MILLALATVIVAGASMLLVIIFAKRYSVVLSFSRLVKAFSTDFLIYRILFTFSVPNM